MDKEMSGYKVDSKVAGSGKNGEEGEKKKDSRKRFVARNPFKRSKSSNSSFSDNSQVGSTPKHVKKKQKWQQQEGQGTGAGAGKQNPMISTGADLIEVEVHKVQAGESEQRQIQMDGRDKDETKTAEREPAEPKEVEEDDSTDDEDGEENDGEEEEREYGESEIDQDEESDNIERIVEEITTKAAQKKKKKKKGKDSKTDSTHINIEQQVTRAVEKAITNILPHVCEAIANTVTQKMERKIGRLERQVENLKSDLEMEKVKNVIKQEKAEQYGKRDNFILHGVKERDGEKTEDLINCVVDLGGFVDLPINKDAIGDIYRIGRKREKNRPIIVKTNRIVKTNLLGAKKTLKQHESVIADNRFEDKIAMYDDTTQTRKKLMEAAKECPSVEFSYIVDGNVICKMRSGGFTRVEDADDLFKVGVNELDYTDFYPGLNSS